MQIRQWRVLRANTRWIEGIALETIDDVPGKDTWAMVLIHRDWASLYFMQERKAWTEDDYLEYAKRRMNELGITPP